MGIVTIFALRQRSEARTQRRAARIEGLKARTAAGDLRTALSTARAQKLIAQALLQAGDDPDESLKSAVAAWNLKPTPTPSARGCAPAGTARIRTLAVLNVGAPVKAVAVNRSGTVVAAAGGGGTPLQAGRAAAAPPPPPQAQVTDVAFSPSGRFVATASRDGTAAIWHVASGRRIQTLRHGLGVNDVAYSSSGDRLATASEDGTVKIWHHLPRATLETPIRRRPAGAVGLVRPGRRAGARRLERPLRARLRRGLGESSRSRHSRAAASSRAPPSAPAAVTS